MKKRSTVLKLKLAKDYNPNRKLYQRNLLLTAKNVHLRLHNLLLVSNNKISSKLVVAVIIYLNTSRGSLLPNFQFNNKSTFYQINPESIIVFWDDFKPFQLIKF
jgi:hypothetical protein